MIQKLKYKRILLKLSGESLMGKKGHGIDPPMLDFFAEEIKKIHELGVEIGIEDPQDFQLEDWRGLRPAHRRPEYRDKHCQTAWPAQLFHLLSPRATFRQPRNVLVRLLGHKMFGEVHR